MSYEEKLASLKTRLDGLRDLKKTLYTLLLELTFKEFPPPIYSEEEIGKRIEILEKAINNLRIRGMELEKEIKDTENLLR